VASIVKGSFGPGRIVAVPAWIRRRRRWELGALSWALYGGLLRRRWINKLSLKIFDKTVWLWRRLDPVFPWPGLSLVVVARKPALHSGS
jgi:hypothetical protein